MQQIFRFGFMGFMLLLISACTGQDSAMTIMGQVAVSDSVKITPANYQFSTSYHFQKMLYPNQQVGEYVRRIFEDSKGNLWFGTNSQGLCQFNGNELFYFSTYNGLGGNQVTAIMEDAGKNIWCATQGGVSRFDGKTMTNFTMHDGLGDNWVWSLYQDSKGTIWAGTLNGLSRFDGTRFISVQLPATKVQHPESDLSPGRITAITEDADGKLWFGTDGGGAYAFDGKTFINLTKQDGLCDNNISTIMKDSKGNIWFGSMHGGLSRFDGNHFTSFNHQDGIGNNEVWNIYEDKTGNIWFSSEGYGVYRYDGKSFTNFGEKQGLNIKAVQTIYEDSKGRLWIGGGGGLYRFDGKDSFFNVTREGLTDGC